MRSFGEHIPVLADEVVDFLRPQASGRYIDGTVGGGGHARLILEASAPTGRLLGLDADPAAADRARAALEPYQGRATVVSESYAELAAVAERYGFRPADGILLDLGFSTYQVEASDRGFSFAREAPLDMRYDPRRGPTAADLVNTLPEAELADLIYRYGEERRSRAIARAIVRERAKRPLLTTTRLAEVVAGAVGGRRAGIHPATRTFQALRIAVNSELENLAAVLPQAVEVLAPGGRLAVISFHSLEDRIVKRFIAREAAGCVCPPRLPMCVCGMKSRLKLVTKRSVTPSADELARNPRGRSARLRVAERVED